MSLARRRTAFNSQQQASSTSKDVSSMHNGKSNTSNEAEELFPSVRTISLQLSVLGLALVLLYLRKSGISIMGFKLGLLWGSVPSECLILSLLIGKMAARDLT
jgi:hypothetical protein